jgi:hypothetical protein
LSSPSPDDPRQIAPIAALVRLDVLDHFFGGQGTVNVPCFSAGGKTIAFVTYPLVR